MKSKKVEPIKDLNQLHELEKYLYDKSRRDYCLFVIGINTGLRVGDILKLTVEDVKDANDLHIIEQKKQEPITVHLNNACKTAIENYLEYSNLKSGTLFPSKKDNHKPITSIHTWRIIKQAADYVGIKENIGTHTMRHTFAYHNFREGNAGCVGVGKMLNHSPNSSSTMRYLGITQEELNEKVYRNMNLGGINNCVSTFNPLNNHSCL